MTDPKKWRKAKEAYWTSCDGLTNDKQFTDANDTEDRVLDCHETDEPIEHWCGNCIGWEAVCHLQALEIEEESFLGSIEEAEQEVINQRGGEAEEPQP